MKNVMETKKDYGYVEFADKEYILIQDAYLGGMDDEAAYYADAIKADDEPDDDGYVKIYKVEWDIIFSDTEDAGDACDWDNPADVSAIGARFNLRDGSVF